MKTKKQKKLKRWLVECEDGDHTHSLIIVARKATRDTSSDFETVKADHVIIKLGMNVTDVLDL